jgi:hypothetical protein
MKTQFGNFPTYAAFRHLALALLFGFVNGCGQKSGHVPITQWTPYVSSDGQFSIDLPGAPKVEDAMVGTSKTKTILFPLSDDDAFMVYLDDIRAGLADLRNPETIEKALDANRDGILEPGGFTLTREDKITFGQYPGRYMEMVSDKNSDLIMRSKIYLIDNRLYALTVCGKKSFAMSPDADRYWASFKLLK